jgi:hypothetical protein
MGGWGWGEVVSYFYKHCEQGRNIVENWTQELLLLPRDVSLSRVAAGQWKDGLLKM